MGPSDSPEYRLFVSSSRAFLDKEASLTRVRQLHASRESFHRGWWQNAAELGWASMLVPEELGGGNVSGNGVADLAMIAELAGRTVAPGPLHPVSTVLAGLVEDENAGTKLVDVIGALVAGEQVASWAVYEPSLGWNPLLPNTIAKGSATGYRITGVKDRVEAGMDCDAYLVTARLDGAVRQFLIPADTPGVSAKPQASIDLVKRYAQITFTEVEVGLDSIVGSAEQTPALIARQALVAQLLQCAEIVGTLDTVVEFTIAWARDRYSFGRPLASYQALKHRFADMKVGLEACRATTAAAVDAAGKRPGDAAWAISVAKAYVGERAPQIMQACIQLHGGIGVTWEHDLHLFLRRITLYRSLFGTPDEHSRQVCDLAERLKAA